MAPQMHMPPTALPMPSQTKTRHPVHTWCPQPNTTTYLTIHKLHDTIHWFHHDRFLEQARTHKHTKYDTLIHNIRNNGWKINALITITTGVRGGIHEHSLEQLNNLKLPKSSIKTLMNNLPHNAIKYLTHMILNKRKLDNKPNPCPPPLKGKLTKVTPLEPTSQRGIKPHTASWATW